MAESLLAPGVGMVLRPGSAVDLGLVRVLPGRRGLFYAWFLIASGECGDVGRPFAFRCPQLRVLVRMASEASGASLSFAERQETRIDCNKTMSEKPTAPDEVEPPAKVGTRWPVTPAVDSCEGSFRTKRSTRRARQGKRNQKSRRNSAAAKVRCDCIWRRMLPLDLGVREGKPGNLCTPPGVLARGLLLAGSAVCTDTKRKSSRPDIRTKKSHCLGRSGGKLAGGHCRNGYAAKVVG